MKYMDILIKSLENLAIKFYYHYEEERKNLLKIVKEWDKKEGKK